jgi:hypothetical protein
MIDMCELSLGDAKVSDSYLGMAKNRDFVIHTPMLSLLTMQEFSEVRYFAYSFLIEMDCLIVEIIHADCVRYGHGIRSKLAGDIIETI